jgi:RNA polymerase sigma-70 factor, ECF subfamily
VGSPQRHASATYGPPTGTERQDAGVCRDRSHINRPMPSTPGGHPLRHRVASPPLRAFEEVLAEHLDSLYRTALRLCRGHEADAEDLLQEATLRAFDGYGRLRDPSVARAWLFTILGRTHLNRVRSSRRRPETASADLEESAFEAALAGWSPMPSPADLVEARQLGEQLTHALDELPAEQRAVVLLVDVEGFTQREVAGMLEVPEGTVASRLFRARRQLRAALETPARDALLRRHQ